MLMCATVCFISIVPPSIHVLKTNFRPIKRNHVVLSCPAMGMPFPNVTWMKERELVVPTERVRILASGRQLEIQDTRESDTARYTCVATNVAGQAKKDFDVHVLGKEAHDIFKLNLASFADIPKVSFLLMLIQISSLSLS